MNYLGHLYFSAGQPALMVGNILGDFVKGSHYKKMPVELQKGIILHRKIDHYTDQHPSILRLKSAIQREIPKVNGIAIDLIFDHLLAREWKNYSHQNLNDFLLPFYETAAIYQSKLPENMAYFLNNLRTKKYIEHYAETLFLERASHYLANKISFPSNLGNTLGVFEEKKSLFELSFKEFMLEANTVFQHQ
jgi:acyl carrier protein phosphodiesterase